MSPATATATAEYELVLMLDPEVPEERREQLAGEVRKRIEAGGSLKNDTAWGMRKLAYEIRQRTEADYRFFRFETAGPVLDELNHSLRIADGVLRFRIFKVDPRSPTVVPPPPAPSHTAAAPRGARQPDARRDDVEAAEPEATAAEPAPEPAAESAEPAEAPTAEPSQPAPAEPEAPPEGTSERPPAEPTE